LQTPMHKRIFPMTRYIYRHSDAIVVYGSHVREYLVMEGVDPRKIFIAWHATDNEFYGRTVPSMEREEMRSALKIPPGKKVVLYLGRLEESKGVEFLIRAFARLNRDDSILVLAGTGSAQNNLEGLSRELGIHQNVRFAGYVPIETAPRYYAIAYIYVLPSITTAAGREPWGLVVNEAFNQGVPVIATDAVGAVVGGLVQEDVNGLIVPEKNENALASALMRILDDPDLCNRMGENAKRIVQEWNYKRNVAGYLGAIKYILESG